MAERLSITFLCWSSNFSFRSLMWSSSFNIWCLSSSYPVIICSEKLANYANSSESLTPQESLSSCFISFLSLLILANTSWLSNPLVAIKSPYNLTILLIIVSTCSSIFFSLEKTMRTLKRLRKLINLSMNWRILKVDCFPPSSSSIFWNLT
jgi:hypothetical protein